MNNHQDPDGPATTIVITAYADGDMPMSVAMVLGGMFPGAVILPSASESDAQLVMRVSLPLAAPEPARKRPGRKPATDAADEPLADPTRPRRGRPPGSRNRANGATLPPADADGPVFVSIDGPV